MLSFTVQILLIGLIAFAVSILGNIAGFGGGVFLVPSLILLFLIEAEIAVATVLTALFFPALIGTIGAWRKNHVDIRFGLIFGIPSAAGTFIGALSIQKIEESIVVILISVIAFCFGLRMIIYYFKEKHDKKNNIDSSRDEPIFSFLSRIKPIYKIKNGELTNDISLTIVFLLGLAVGVISGLFGISGGWIQVPIFILLFRIDPLKASGTSLFIILLKTFVGGITYIARQRIDWIILLILAVTLVLGALVGNWLKGKITGTHLSLIAALAILLVAIFTVLSVILNW